MAAVNAAVNKLLQRMGAEEMDGAHRCLRPYILWTEGL